MDPKFRCDKSPQITTSKPIAPTVPVIPQKTAPKLFTPKVTSAPKNIPHKTTPKSITPQLSTPQKAITPKITASANTVNTTNFHENPAAMPMLVESAVFPIATVAALAIAVPLIAFRIACWTYDGLFRKKEKWFRSPLDRAKEVLRWFRGGNKSNNDPITTSPI